MNYCKSDNSSKLKYKSEKKRDGIIRWNAKMLLKIEIEYLYQKAISHIIMPNPPLNYKSEKKRMIQSSSNRGIIKYIKYQSLIIYFYH